MYRRHKDRANFLCIYVREAHPIEGWRSEGNDRVGIAIAQPKTPGERHKVAHQCSAALEITMPLVVDAIDDRVGHAYSGMPDRLYVLDRRGRVTYQGGRGPFGFKSGEMEQALVMTLLEQEGQVRKNKWASSSTTCAAASMMAVVGFGPAAGTGNGREAISWRSRAYRSFPAFPGAE